MRLSDGRLDSLLRFGERGSSSSGSNVICSASAKYIIVSLDEGQVRLHVNSNLLIASMLKKDSSSVGDGSFKDR